MRKLLKRENDYMTPTMPFLSIDLREAEAVSNRDGCTPVFIVALFPTVKIRNQPRCLSRR